MVIFAGGKFRENVGEAFHVGGNFHDTTNISFIKAYEIYFRVGVIFAKKSKARKTRKLPPRENFHVYSKQKRKTTYWLTRIPALPLVTHVRLATRWAQNRVLVWVCHCVVVMLTEVEVGSVQIGADLCGQMKIYRKLAKGNFGYSISRRIKNRTLTAIRYIYYTCRK